MTWTLVLAPGHVWERDAAQLAGDAAIARRRASSAAPGDRREALRHHRLADQLEAAARGWVTAGSATTLPAGEPPAGDSWWAPGTDEPALPPAARAHLARGGAVVALADVYSADPTAEPPTPPPPPRERWEAPAGTASALFDGQLRAALAGRGPIVPSGVPNRVLAEGLRRAAARHADAGHAPVIYRDGSEARPFPLRGLKLTDTAPREADLRCALISLRHPEMDPLVDFAWIRNRDASQVRPAAQTDEVVHEWTRARLRRLAELRPGLVLEVFQTGLEPAIVGFYRALAEHLAERPGSIIVRPRYFRGGEDYGFGTVWATA
jgi:hypothetical protein